MASIMTSDWIRRPSGRYHPRTWPRGGPATDPRVTRAAPTTAVPPTTTSVPTRPPIPRLPATDRRPGRGRLRALVVGDLLRVDAVLAQELVQVLAIHVGVAGRLGDVAVG